MSTLKKVVISSNNKSKAIAFFEEIKARKEEAKKKIEARTEGIREMIKKQVSA